MKREYFTINESAAKTANDINNFSDYKPNNATNGYIAACNEVYDLAEEIAEKKPQQAEKAAYMATRYAKKYAEYLNNYYRNEAACPSVLICGAGNFPTRRKEKQNARRDSLMKEYNYIQEYKNKIKHLLTNDAPILSSDADAIERLQDKINDLEAEKELMKEINAYYRKNKSLEEFEKDIPHNLQRHIDIVLKYGWGSDGRLFDTSNTNQEIKRLKDRLQKLQEIKDEGTNEKTYEGFTVVENADLMRLQVLFDDIPDATVRDLLKSNGFKWSPKNQAWQRQLTDNAKWSLNRIIDKLA